MGIKITKSKDNAGEMTAPQSGILSAAQIEVVNRGGAVRDLLINYNAWNINNEVGFVPSALSRAMDSCYAGLKCWGKKKTRRERKGSVGKVEVASASTPNLGTGPSVVEHKGHH